MNRMELKKKERATEYGEDTLRVIASREDLNRAQKFGVKRHLKSICLACDSLWFYKTLRCPSCGSANIGSRE